MKINYSVTLEPSDVTEAINTYLQANGVNATVTADDLMEGMNDDLSILIQTQGEAAPANKPVKRTRRKPTKVVQDELHNQSQTQEAEETSKNLTAIKQVVDEKSKDQLGTRDQTILEQANEDNMKRIAQEKLEAKTTITEKVKAVDIDDVDESNSPVDDTAQDDAVEDKPAVKNTAEEIVTNAKNSSVPLAKQGIFKKRAKKS